MCLWSESGCWGLLSLPKFTSTTIQAWSPALQVPSFHSRLHVEVPTLSTSTSSNLSGEFSGIWCWVYRTSGHADFKKTGTTSIYTYWPGYLLPDGLAKRHEWRKRRLQSLNLNRWGNSSFKDICGEFAALLSYYVHNMIFHFLCWVCQPPAHSKPAPNPSPVELRHLVEQELLPGPGLYHSRLDPAMALLSPIV